MAAALALLALVLASGAIAWRLERRRRLMRPMAAGLHTGITVPVETPWALWHNPFSLCSKKVRLCLAELGVPYASHAVELIETGAYGTLAPAFLAVNPAGLVPVLVHHGHPVCESHAIIRHAAEQVPGGDSLLGIGPAERALVDAWVQRSSLWGDDPPEHAAESAGNCVPGLTLPLFAAMIGEVPLTRILEGLLYHRLRRRPAMFLLFRITGLAGFARIGPAMRVLAESRREMHRHLDALEDWLATPRPDGSQRSWIAAERLTLADISWAAILERLQEGGWDELIAASRRPQLAAWWARLRERPSYTQAMQGDNAHPAVGRARARILALAARDTRFKEAVFGS